MHRFYVSSRNISGNKIIVDDRQQIHHLRDVLRLKTKDAVMIFDDHGNQYRCFIEKLSDKVILNIIERQSFSKTKPGIKITLAVALPKKSKMDELVDKLTQLGVARIIPLETERVAVNLDDKKKKTYHQRWERVALSASQQSQRNTLPVIDSIKDIKDVLSHLSGFDLKLMPTLYGERKSLKEVLEKPQPKPRPQSLDVLVLIGPEGDFTPAEINLAKQAGCIPVSLGDLVLRVETAAVATASFIKLSLYEDD